MRVLILMPMADGQTGPAVKYAFEQLGHTVKAVDARIQPGRSYDVACDFKPDLVFCSRLDKLTGQVIQIKEKFKNVVACTWNVDTRLNIGHWKHLFPLIQACDYYFVPASRLLPEWRKINPNTFWLPQGVQNEIYRKPTEITEEDREKYTCDVCWAGHIGGGGHRFRCTYLDTVSAMGINFKRWGCAGYPQIYNEEHNKMAALSKINLCISVCPENEKYTSVRNYKMMGAGGFILELYRKGLYDIFPSDTIRDYENRDDLVKKIRYWLANEKERKEFAERGFKWVHSDATYTHRIQQALEIMRLK